MGIKEILSLLTCTMISCEVRWATREETLLQMERVGLNPVIFLSPCDPAGPDQNRAVAYDALHYADSIGQPLLYCEDDIDLHGDFPLALEMAWGAMLEGMVVYLYVNDRLDRMSMNYPEDIKNRILHGPPIPRQLVQPRRYGALYGSQCILMPPEAITAARIKIQHMDSGHEHRTAGDTAILKAWAWKRWPVRILVPHPVQHRRVRTGREPLTEVQHKGRVSRSFGMQRI